MREERAIRFGRRITRFALAACVALLLLLPASTIADHVGLSGTPKSVSVTPAASAGPFSAELLWNGANATSANSASSAFTFTSGETANATFHFAGTSLLVPPPAITNASLTLTFFGLALTTNTDPFHVIAGGEQARINWSFGPLIQLTEGVYQMSAKITNASGGSAWSETFYIDVKAPYSLESGLVVFLIILSLAEIYWIAASIRGARGRKPKLAKVNMRKAGGDPNVAAPSTPMTEWSAPGETPPSTGPATPPTEPPAGGAP
ncbi:MAG TPA: hypothetical protein VK455_06380 [Thermoplasmata archaeon]|nr:hypothetical protein [Thermoplasmata archaeon]